MATKKKGELSAGLLAPKGQGTKPVQGVPQRGVKGEEVHTSTGSQVNTRKARKADGWGMPRPGEPIAKLGIDLTPEVRQAFRAKAISEGRDGADLIREWIRAYLEGDGA